MGLMDPDETLRELRQLVAQVQEHRDAQLTPPPDVVARIAELVDALDGWLLGGGFLPDDWHRAQVRAGRAAGL